LLKSAAGAGALAASGATFVARVVAGTARLPRAAGRIEEGPADVIDV